MLLENDISGGSQHGRIPVDFSEDLKTMTVYHDSRLFWKEYSKRNLNECSLMNLEPDPIKAHKKFESETIHFEAAVKLRGDETVLDIGAGPGVWSEYFSTRTRKVYAIEREVEFVRIFRDRNSINGIQNIDVVCADILDCNYEFEEEVDLVFLSGVTIYLEDGQLATLLSKIKNILNVEGIVVHRDAYGTETRYVIDNKFSDRLEADYSAIYRTREEYDSTFAQAGLAKIYDEDMYPEGSYFNKWRETRLRLAVYKNL